MKSLEVSAIFVLPSARRPTRRGLFNYRTGCARSCWRHTDALMTSVLLPVARGKAFDNKLAFAALQPINIVTTVFSAFGAINAGDVSIANNESTRCKQYNLKVNSPKYSMQLYILFLCCCFGFRRLIDENLYISCDRAGFWLLPTLKNSQKIIITSWCVVSSVLTHKLAWSHLRVKF